MHRRIGKYERCPGKTNDTIIDTEVQKEYSQESGDSYEHLECGNPWMRCDQQNLRR